MKDCYLKSMIFTITLISFFFFFNDTATTEIYTLSLHDALPIYGFCERFGRSIGAHYEIAPLPRILETGKKNDGRGGIAQIENSGIPDNGNNFNILKFWHEAEANGFSYGIAIRKEALRESAVHDGDMRALLVISLLKWTAAKKGNRECFEKTGGDGRAICKEMDYCVRIGRRQRDRFVPRIRTGNGKIRKGNRTHAGKAGNPLQELLVIAAHVQIVVPARLWIELDLEQAGLVKTEIEGTQPLEAAHKEASSKQ